MTEANFQNRTLFHGDNLTFLRAINSETVDLIATDPPFQKGHDFHATPGSLAAGAAFKDRWSWERDVQGDWEDKIKDDFPAVWEVIDAAKVAYGEDMAAFLCWMGIRLLEMKRVLKDTGSIYLHLDDTASAWIKCLMDAIFGKDNFRNEVIWKRTSGRSDAKRFGRVHDTILFYSKSSIFSWNTQWMLHNEEYIKSTYRNCDERGHFRASNLTAPAHGRTEGEYFSSWKEVVPSPGRMWNLPMKGGMADWIESNLILNWKSMTGVIERLDLLDSVGLIIWPLKVGGIPSLKLYLDATRGIAVGDIFTDIGRLGGQSKEKTGYPTQKPLALYERIIKASSNKGDLVLDPFCGCATTPIAAERLGRQWLGMDLWDGAYDVIMERMSQNNLLVPGATPHQLIQQESVTYINDVNQMASVNAVWASPPINKRKERISVVEPGPVHSRADMKTLLLDEFGIKCQGCDRTFDSPEYLELDHKTPRSDGGVNHISNRMLLCSPCNRRKSNTLTLSGLRRKNQNDGFLSK